MISFGSVLTIGGIGLAIGFVESVLESMGKEKYAMFIRLLAIGGLGLFTLTVLNDVITEVARMFL